MLIREMTRAECVALLMRNRLGRLACAREGQPYITPIHFAYDADFLYSFATVGKKIEWMRENPLVCVEVDDIESSRSWSTVIVTGRYEELPATPEYEEARDVAQTLLQRQPMWWEPGSMREPSAEHPADLVHFRIHIAHLTGRAAGRDETTPIAEVPNATAP